MDGATAHILTSRPERVVGFDPGLADRLLSIAGGERAALVEVAGRDSVAACLSAARSGEYRFLIPTVSYTGTEFGDWGVVLSSAASLIERLSDVDGVTVFENAVLLGSPRWWHACSGRYSGMLHSKYGFQATCAACHMYLHASRVPFARSVGASAVISGERLTHDGRLKLNQLAPALDSYRKAVASQGVSLEMPLRDMEEGSRVEEIVGPWPEADRQMSCVLEANYRDTEGGLRVDEAALRRYLEEFLFPFTVEVLDRFAAGENPPDYAAVAEETITGRSSL